MYKSELKECDMTKPYSFVSYSWKDFETVEKEINPLQENGYNIWIDKKKIDKREASWDLQVRNVISNPNCKVILFFLSRNSIKSENCLKEIEYANSKHVTEQLERKIPVVFIEAEPICQELKQLVLEVLDEINADTDLSNEKKNVKFDAVKKFYEDYVEKENWNEKVRIRYSQQVTSERVNEIVRSLPEMTEIEDSSEPIEVVRHKLLEKLDEPNVWLTYKRETEDDIFTTYEKFYKVKKITVLNYAGTTLIAGHDIAGAYTQSRQMREWINRSIASGTLEATYILTAPNSYAAVDAETYKMHPDERKCDAQEIIRNNLNALIQFKMEHVNAKLEVYVTDIALPYGVMILESMGNSKNNYMKVDLYAPNVNDYERPSFYLFKSEPNMNEMYRAFERVVQDVKNNHSVQINVAKDLGWMMNSPVVHRGKIADVYREHTMQAFKACINAAKTVEVDLMEMSDGELLVCRDMKFNADEGERKLSLYTVKDLFLLTQRGSLDEEIIRHLEGVFSFSEFLRYLDGRVGVIIEIKDYDMDEKSMYHRELAKKVTDALHSYSGRFAIHSANPYVLNEVRKRDKLIPLGQITLDFEGYQDVTDETKKMHLSGECLNISKPDFISCCIHSMERNSDFCTRVKSYSSKNNVPLLGWTVKGENDRRIAETIECDNYIFEGWE